MKIVKHNVLKKTFQTINTFKVEGRKQKSCSIFVDTESLEIILKLKIFLFSLSDSARIMVEGKTVCVLRTLILYQRLVAFHQTLSCRSDGVLGFEPVFHKVDLTVHPERSGIINHFGE